MQGNRAKARINQEERIMLIGGKIKIPFKALLFFCLSMFFFWVWYERYLRWDFNELGRYYDAESQTVYTESGFIWSIPTFIFLLMSLISARKIFKRN